MSIVKYLLLIASFFATTLFSQSTDTKINTIENYNDWGWSSIVMENGLITVATVPVIGARIMQYDLGTHPSIYVNPSEIGKTHKPSQSSWYNYGGYKVWPAPQSRWSWPPPAIIDAGEWSGEIIDNTTDSVSVYVKSQKETWSKTPNISMERRSVIFKNSTRVKIEQSIINEGATEINWSVWDVTQSIVNHKGERDFENFWVYFPIKKEGSLFGESGVKKDGATPAWVGEVSPGIFAVRFRPDGTKIYADSPEGWIAYVDELEGYAYLKLFDIWEGQDYPDDGARNEVWINNNPYYLEVEVVSPIWPIAASGGKITFVENWYATKLFGPVIGANFYAAIAKRLRYGSDGTTLSGIYGVFYEGSAKVVFLDDQGTVIAEGNSHTISPMEEFDLEEALATPANAKTVELRIYNVEGELLGSIESKPIDLLSTVNLKGDQLLDFNLRQNFPNPFNPITSIVFSLGKSQHISLVIYDMNGRHIETLKDEFLSRGQHNIQWDASPHPTGVYIAHLQAEVHQQQIKMVLLK